ncbi:unnamed protein product [Adineta ricciae]|uniref:Replication protein A OB domain-containing protein n=1 Tax=Adineta ricciae TaxID=249248 RepID=A0A814BMF7_ADIRI|nr:unnamed protein product [Adineta ricciae]
MPRAKKTIKSNQKRKKNSRSQASSQSITATLDSDLLFLTCLVSNIRHTRQRTKPERRRESADTRHQTNHVATNNDGARSTEQPESSEVGHFSSTITISSQSSQSNLSHHEFDQPDFHSNLHNEVKPNKSSHSLINQRTTHEISNITRSNLTTNETIHNQQQNIDTFTNVNDEPSASNRQTSITTYFAPTDEQFQRIVDLNEHSTNFRIRSKIIYLSNVRHFGSNKVIDGILSDASGEIKFVAFNDQGERVTTSLKVNENIILQNGEIAIANPRYRTPFSRFEIRICPSTAIRTYQSNSFNPLIQITRKPLHEVLRMPHGALVDVEGTVILDRGLISSTGHDATNHIIRRTFKITDDTSTINVTAWNEKTDEIPENIMNKTIRIRNGKINYYNDYISINASSQTIIQFID